MGDQALFCLCRCAVSHSISMDQSLLFEPAERRGSFGGVVGGRLYVWGGCSDDGKQWYTGTYATPDDAELAEWLSLSVTY